MPFICRGDRRAPANLLAGIAAVLALAFLLPVTVEAQYFGRNKVQYDDFDFQVIETPHFDIYYYPEKEEAIQDVTRMAERWYERLARLFQHEFTERKPLIFYADHPDFQQTNVISGMIGEGTGGVAESLKNRIIMPLAGSYAATDHVLGHELVHAFQYDLAQSRRGGGIQALGRVPLWMIEGMAEYLSVGQDDTHTGMWLRDAHLRDDFPTLRQLTRERRYFPYRFGQAFWTYVGGTYGDEAVVRTFRTALRVGWEPAIEQVLGVPSDTLSIQWRESVEEHYGPLMEGRTAPAEVGTLLLSPATGAGRQNVAPAVSPDGSRMVFMSEKDLFSFDLFLADARTGEIIRQLTSATADPHWDALRFIDSAGGWSPDGESVAFVVFAGGRNEIVIVDSERGQVQNRVPLDEEIGEVSGPTWSPDGRHLAFSGQVGGLTDLFTVEVETGQTTQHTHDRHAVFQPVFSPDGRHIAYVSDRGEETDFDRLSYSEMQITLFDLETSEIQVLEIFGQAKHINPQFTPDGRGLYFISDPDGFSDIFRLEMETGEVQRVTRIATGVSGITGDAPAMSVARETGTVVFSVFDEFEYHVYSMDSQQVDETRTVAETVDPVGRLVPPRELRVPSRVASYLQDYETALASPSTYQGEQARAYDPGLSLDWVGQPMVGVGTDQFGTFVGGSAAAFFSDMLGNRNLGVAVQAQGTARDIGGQFVYQNLARRWNWGVSAGRIPYLLPQAYGTRRPDGGVDFIQQRFRIFDTSAMGLASYPFSTTRRVDFSGGLTRLSFHLEEELLRYNQFGQLVERERRTITEGVPDPLNLFQSSVALVGDNSFFGFTSPVRGTRYRAEVGTTTGTVNFQSVNLDYRRYFNPHRNLTLAFRGMHRGRYGSDVESDLRDPRQTTQFQVIRPYFLGWETYMRGYSAYSFEPALECVPSDEFGSCPQFTRLQGHRVGVMNAEVRIPLIGTDQYGILDFGFVPTELVLFADAGVAWDGENEPNLKWSTTSLDRIPVASTGVSARINLLGMFIMEIYYAQPWQRPDKGAHWGFQLAPGW
jgi:Tol biopolymer transport system component